MSTYSAAIIQGETRTILLWLWQLAGEEVILIFGEGLTHSWHLFKRWRSSHHGQFNTHVWTAPQGSCASETLRLSFHLAINNGFQCHVDLNPQHTGPCDDGWAGHHCFHETYNRLFYRNLKIIVCLQKGEWYMLHLHALSLKCDLWNWTNCEIWYVYWRTNTLLQNTMPNYTVE